MSERIEEIRHTLEHEDAFHYYRYTEDVAYLLARIDELERENERLQEHTDGWARSADAYMEAKNQLEERVAELERENGRLRQECIFWKEMAYSGAPDE